MKHVVVFDDVMALDLVAHFLGIAQHHNINAPPSGVRPVLPRPAHLRLVTPAPANVGSTSTA